MKAKKILAIGIVALVACGVGLVSAMVNSTSTEDAISMDEVLIQGSPLINDVFRDGQMTDEELKELYNKGAKVVIVEDIKDKRAINHIKAIAPDYDLILPGDLAVKLDRIMAAEYKEKHGYLPEEIGISPDNITREELEKLVEEGKVGDAPPIISNLTTDDFEPPGDPNHPPYELNEIIYVDVHLASDADHRPSATKYYDVKAATDRFEDEFGVIMCVSQLTDWDASDVDDNIYNLYDDFTEDFPNPGTNQVLQGWVDNSTGHNGLGALDGHHSVCAEYCEDQLNWPDDKLSQHELSHNFDAQDGHKSGGNCTWLCIMDYRDVLFTDGWCSYHWDIVNAGVWGP